MTRHGKRQTICSARTSEEIDLYCIPDGDRRVTDGGVIFLCSQSRHWAAPGTGSADATLPRCHLAFPNDLRFAPTDGVERARARVRQDSIDVHYQSLFHPGWR